jgi:acetyltransferase-like isoleucine patch superfamily enzyme
MAHSPTDFATFVQIILIMKRIFSHIQLRILRLFKPVMLSGFKRHDGVWLPKTRYGSTTLFEAKNKLDIEDNVFINHYCFIDASNGLRIGEGSQICCWVSLLTHSSHISIRLYGKEYRGTEMKGYVKGSVDIGAYTFVGPHAIVMPDSKIGKGSIVAAYSYVKGEFPDFAIIAGNPAKVVGDTRKMDEKFLAEYPELQAYYKEWADKK